MLLGTPSGALSFITVWATALIPRLFRNARIYTFIGLAVIPLAGSIALLTSPVGKGGNGNAWGIIVATWLAGCSSAPLCAASALVASNVKGNTKKSVVSAGFFIFYCVGCIGKHIRSLPHPATFVVLPIAPETIADKHSSQCPLRLGRRMTHHGTQKVVSCRLQAGQPSLLGL